MRAMPSEDVPNGPKDLLPTLRTTRRALPALQEAVSSGCARLLAPCSCSCSCSCSFPLLSALCSLLSALVICSRLLLSALGSRLLRSALVLCCLLSLFPSWAEPPPSKNAVKPPSLPPSPAHPSPHCPAPPPVPETHVTRQPARQAAPMFHVPHSSRATGKNMHLRPYQRVPVTLSLPAPACRSSGRIRPACPQPGTGRAPPAPFGMFGMLAACASPGVGPSTDSSPSRGCGERLLLLARSAVHPGNLKRQPSRIRVCVRACVRVCSGSCPQPRQRL
ncbi:hypothetical protein CALVIDRAFT_140563 [Calocera viscosa TUFC12733]|uniref:Uncharacterized protein n=1 Tax=Calocera viscosa (strain TUFC12733) TaxID=1330018 RepID=A0A167M358_CALVF|nr:hypothetical protein CALVIDRAFT_140563 [Calocera viscosa TUFC12733]